MQPLIPKRDPDLRLLSQVDGICDEFEHAWRRGHSPKISDFLGKVDATLKTCLLTELVRIDAFHQRRNGLDRSLRDYVSQWPEYADTLSLLTDEFPRPHTAPPLPARYAMQGLLGTGAFGFVWKAWDLQLQRYVAIKTPRSQSHDAEQVRLYLHEARVAALLNHPGVVRIIDFGEYSDAVYIVYEFAVGHTLREFVSKKRLSTSEAVSVTVGLLHILEYVHSAGVIHRDLKPGNIMVDGDGKPSILDFGLAKRLDIESTIAAEGTILGSLAYMSPEQARGNSDEIAQGADIYAIGAILYELLAGRVMFSGSPEQVLRQILNDDPVPPSAVQAEIPHDLETICLKATAKECIQRYASVSDMLSDLDAFAKGERITARRISILHRVRRWVTKNRLAFTAISFAAVAVLLLLQTKTPRPNERLQLPSPNEGTKLSGPQEGSIGQVVQIVQIDTVPPGAHLTFYPLSPFDGTPELHKAIESDDTTPSVLSLPPSDYLVVATPPANDHLFMEVFRKVPFDSRSTPGAHDHLRWAPHEDVITLPKITLPPIGLLDDMVRFEGRAGFVAGVSPLDNAIPQLTVDVPSFYMDKTETTVGSVVEATRAIGGPNPLPLMQMGSKADILSHPVTFCSYDDAIAIAERLGKRLPSEFEYEYAATNGGKTRFPFGDSVDLKGAWPIGSTLTTAPFDKAVRAGQVSGLYSNVAEWTTSWGLPYPVRQLSNVKIEGGGEQRIVRGIDSSVIAGEFQPGAESPSARNRISIPRFSFRPDVGFRCVRSHRPVQSKQLSTPVRQE